MAFLQSELPPSTAPGAPVRTARVRAVALSRPGFRHSGLIVRLLFALALATGLALLGIAAARATESFAVGIIAADLVFLVGVAGWSALFVSARR